MRDRLPIWMNRRRKTSIRVGSACHRRKRTRWRNISDSTARSELGNYAKRPGCCTKAKARAKLDSDSVLVCHLFCCNLYIGQSRSVQDPQDWHLRSLTRDGLACAVFEFTACRLHWRLRRYAQRIELHGRSCRMTVGTEESAVIDNDSGTTCAPKKNWAKSENS